MSVALHRQAEALMAEAELLIARGRPDEARKLWLEAAHLEAAAFEQIPKDRGKTRGIIAVSAVALFRDAGAFDDALRLAHEYLTTGGLPDAWQAELEALHDQIRRELEPSAHEFGYAALEKLQFDDAERWYRLSLGFNERLADDRGRARALHQLGVVAQARRQLGDAERLYRLALALSEQLDDERGQACALHNLGTTAYGQQRLDEAERWYRASRTIEQRLRNDHGEGQTLYQLGLLAEDRGDSLSALAYFTSASSLFAKADSASHLHLAQQSIARVRGAMTPSSRLITGQDGGSQPQAWRPPHGLQ